jgi:esterase
MLALNNKTFGQGDPLIILHGLFGTLDNWQTLGRQISEQYMVYLIDQRNHGRSPHTDAMDYEMMANDLHYFLEDNWIFRANILGHSMGGKTAMQFALQYPDMVNKLIIVDIAPKEYVGGHQPIFDALFSLDLNNIEARKEADLQLQQQVKDYGVRQFLLKNLARDKASGGFRWKMNLPVIYKHYQDILAPPELISPFEGKVLFIRGGRSGYIADEDFMEIYYWFPNARIETIPKAGHWVHAEAPNLLLNMVMDFLAD